MSIKEKYGLTDEGVRNVKLGALWTAVSNIAVFAGVGILFLAMGEFADHLTSGAPLPDIAPYALGLAAFVVALFVTEYLAYYYQYGVIYKESGRQRIGLAERLRKLPLSFFGRRDLADLTETIMGDVKTIEHAYSHVLPELYGAYIMLGVAAVGLIAFDWRLAIAALWSAPVALALLFASRRFLSPLMRATRMRNLAVSDDIQEALECVREVRATNQEERYLDGIRKHIDEAERQTVKGELATGICVNGAQIVLRLGIATTVLAGAAFVLEGTCGFMTLFCFLLEPAALYDVFFKLLCGILTGITMTTVSLPAAVIVIYINQGRFLSLLLSFLYSVVNWLLLILFASNDGVLRWLPLLNGLLLSSRLWGWRKASLGMGEELTALPFQEYVFTALYLLFSFLICTFLIIRFYKKWSR